MTPVTGCWPEKQLLTYREGDGEFNFAWVWNESYPMVYVYAAGDRSVHQRLIKSVDTVINLIQERAMLSMADPALVAAGLAWLETQRAAIERDLGLLDAPPTRRAEIERILARPGALCPKEIAIELLEELRRLERRAEA